jgi:DNA-binding response OmpR family regulator
MAYLLIVDDDADFADAVATVLREEGHETQVEIDPAEVPELLNRRLPDAMILDVMFPENPCGGFDLAREIAKTHKRLPILMLTAVNSRFPLGFSDRDIHSEWLPVAAFIEKPVDFRLLKEKVRQLLEQAAAGETGAG